jgi:hypothetical protein
MGRRVKARSAMQLATTESVNKLDNKVTAVDNWTQNNALTEKQQDSLFNTFIAKAENFDETILGRVVKLEEGEKDTKMAIVAQTGRIDNLKAGIDTLAVDITDLQADATETNLNFEKLGMTAMGN